MDLKHIIEPERQGLWIVVAFILALLALAVAIVGIQRNTELAYITQAEILMLNNKVAGEAKAESAPASGASEQQQK